MLKDTVKEINKNELKNIYIAIYIFAVIILSRNTMISSCLIGFEKSFFILSILSVPIFIMFVNKIINKQLDFNKIKFIAPLIVIILISIIIKRDWQLYNISILFYIIMGLALSSVMDFEYFKKVYINIFFGLAIFSIVTTYIMKPMLIEMNIQEQLEENGIVITNSSQYKFLNLGLGFAMFQKDYIRNYGIFTEPNFYQFYLSIAIIMILFLKNNKLNKYDWSKLLTFVITMISTFSSAAMIGLALIMVIQTIRWMIQNKNDKRKLLLIVLAWIVVGIVMFSVENIRESLVGTYQKIITTNASSESRFGSIQFALENTIQSPIIGNKISEILPYDKLLTNTTLALSAIYGIIPLIYSIYFSFNFISFNNKNSILLKLAVCGTMILAYNSHVYIGVQSFWIILLSTISLAKKGDMEDENKSIMDS